MLLLPYIGFLVPIEDPAVVAQLARWQTELGRWFPYHPLPIDQLHITLHYVGGLQRVPWSFLPNVWQRRSINRLAERVRPVLAGFGAFMVRVGPLNAFPNVIFAEVHDEHACLRRLRAELRRALPLRARPGSRWPYVPHVTLGYLGKQPVAPLVESLAAYRAAPSLLCPVERVQLTIYTQHMTVRPDLLSRAREEIIADYSLDPPEIP